MFDTVAKPVSWLIEALTDTAMALHACYTHRASYRIALDRGNIILDRQGIEIGRLAASAGTLHWEPPDLAIRMVGAAVTLDLPQNWSWQRRLPPIAIDNIAYLGAFVTHQIERISPWRAVDVYFGTSRKPAQDDPTKLVVEIGIVPKKKVEEIVYAVRAIGGTLALAFSTPENHVFTIPLAGDHDGFRAKLRRGVTRALSCITLLLALWLALVEWRAYDLQAQLDELDQAIANRKTALAASRNATASDAAEALRAKRSARPTIVELIDVLTRALPDHAHLVDLHFEKDGIRMSGISNRSSELVVALERSGRFADVKFAAATTRMEDSRADRFALQMRTDLKATP